MTRTRPSGTTKRPARARAKVLGTVLLRAYFEANPLISREAFARKCGASLRTVQRWITLGYVPRTEAHHIAIEAASGGVVPASSWRETFVRGSEAHQRALDLAWGRTGATANAGTSPASGT